MIKSVIKLLISFIIFISFCSNAMAGMTIGTSFVYANINDTKYSFVKNIEIADPGINIGYSKFINNFVLSAQTNRLYIPDFSRSILDKNTEVLLESKTNTIVDNFSIGYKNKRLIPAISISNVEFKNYLYYKEKLIGKEQKHALLYGINLSYIVDRHVITTISYIAPNKEFNLESAFVFGVNYLF